MRLSVMQSTDPLDEKVVKNPQFIPTCSPNDSVWDGGEGGGKLM